MKPPGSPRISVILPLQDQRDAGVECVRAWTAGQTVPANGYEVIALAPGEDPELEQSVRPLLRPGDRWIRQGGASEWELLNRGAREARGEYLFITEAHCVPEPDCLEAMLEELDRTGAPGVRGRSIAEAHGPLGELERDAFVAGLAIEEETDHWRKVLIHSFAVRREAFLDAGGLPTRYGEYSPWPLALALHSRGERLVYSPRPAVRHVYDGDLDDLGAHVREWGWGEIRFRAEVPAEHWEPYLDPIPEWDERLAFSRRGALEVLRGALALRHRGTAAAVLRHLAVALVGPRGLAALAGARASAAARSARRAGNHHERREAFHRFWSMVARRGRLEALAKGWPQGRNGASPDGEEQVVIDLAGPLPGRSVGLHPPEGPPGIEPYRWTDSLALLRVAAPPGERVRARLELYPARPGDRARARVAVDGRQVDVAAYGDAIEFELPGGGERSIVLAFEPYRPPRELRRLGVAVRALRLHPSSPAGRRPPAARPP